MREESTCPSCGRNVPPGEYCGACGGALVGGRHAAGRAHAYAAYPAEHVLHPSVTSTLFPHLPQRHAEPFRLALMIVAAALLIFGYLRLTGPSVAIAAAAVPALYLMYLHEVDVYEAEPLFAIAATLGVGILLGAIWAVLTGRIVSQTLLLNVAPQGAPTGRILLTAVLFPLVVQLLMLIGALILRVTRSYDEALDGFTFGAASAMGFVFAGTLVHLIPELQTGLYSVTGAVPSAARTLLHGLLVPFIAAGTTGLIAAALWLRRSRTRDLPQYGWTTSLPLTVLVAAIVQVGLGLVDVFVVSTVVAFLIYLGVALFLLFWVRIALHHMLLAEAVESPVGPLMPCFNCERLVPRMAFCPNCGVATRATPKLGSGRDGRMVR